MKLQLTILTLLLFSLSSFSQQINTIKLWPNKVPGEPDAKHAPVITDNNSGDVTRLTDITDPAIVVYPASPENNNGKGIIVCPGGGYNILAVDKEGYEVAEWLNTLGYSAFVLQYRVPKKQEGALQDFQRAIRIIKSKATDWKLNPDKIGAIGFSAGASLSARASTRYNEKTYPKGDALDELACRPEFALLIYPGGLDRGENRSLTPEIKIDDKTPSMFVFATADDKHGNSALVITTALRDAKIPVELHLLPKGGHGYGLRPGNIAGETWPALAEQWLQNQF
jgi:acetyl esterase/lipase